MSHGWRRSARKLEKRGSTERYSSSGSAIFYKSVAPRRTDGSSPSTIGRQTTVLGRSGSRNISRVFRKSIGVIRRGVKFDSLRHNVEDALRNADVRKVVRDAIQGHGENGVSREYGSGYYVKTLNEAVQKIGYQGLVLDRLMI